MGGYDVLAAVTEDDILKIHMVAGSSAAGKHRGTGVRNRAAFRRIAADLHRAAEKETPLADLIAGLFDDIERDPQPFTDCNHRTALLLGRFVAKQFGYNLKFSGPEGVKLRKNSEIMSKKEFREWVAKHLVPFE